MSDGFQHFRDLVPQIRDNNPFGNPVFAFRIFLFIRCSHILILLRMALLKSHAASPHTSSASSGSQNDMRHVALSPLASYNSTDSYSDHHSIDEVEAALNNLENDIDDTEQALTEWSHGSSSHRAPSYTTDSLTDSYSGTYSHSASINLPSIGSRPSPTPAGAQAARLSRITEYTEESRSSGATPASHVPRPTSTTGGGLRRSALFTGATAHARSSTDPVGDPTLPPRGRATELIAVFETQAPGVAHTRAASAPMRSASPFNAPSQITSTVQTTTGYTYGHTSFGFNSRSSSPTKSRDGSTLSYTDTRPTMSTLLSPPPPPSKSGESKLRTMAPGTTESHTATGSYLSPRTQSSSTFTGLSPTQTNTRTSATDVYSNTVSGATSMTSTSTLRRPQTSARSPLASVRNIVALWKERTPAASRQAASRLSTSMATLSSSSQAGQGFVAIRERVQRAGERLREGNLHTSELARETAGGNGEASLRTTRSGGLPPGFDLAELSHYAQSNEAPLHIGLLWYLNVHAPPPYRWQRCQALLYPHMLLLSWIAPGGGRGIVALDLLNCTNVQSTPSPVHPSARDDVGTVAARLQSSEKGGQPLMDMLVPFQMLYVDGIERLAVESLVARQRWVNRIWEAVNRPVSAPNTTSVTRSPTGSIRTILSIDSRTSKSSSTSTGSRSTVYVPPMSTLTDIPDFRSDLSSNSGAASNLGVRRRVSLVSSHHTHTVDDTVIQNQEYVYPGDPRHIPPSRGNSLRRTGSMGDLDQEFARALKAKKTALTGSPVTVSSGPSLGQDIFITPPPSIPRGSDRSRSEYSSDEAFLSAGLSGGSSGMRTSVSSTYYSQSGDQTVTGILTDGTSRDITSGDSQLLTSTPSYGGTDESNSYLGTQDRSYTSASPSGSSILSRARQVRRRLNRAASHTLSASFTDESLDKENSGSGSYTYSGTPSSQSYGLSGGYTPGSGGHTLSGTYTPGSGETSALSGGYSPGTGSYTGSQSYTPGSYTLDSGSYTASGTYTSSDNSACSNGSIYPVRNGRGSSSESRSAEGSFTPGTETGYDVCPSSDFSGLTPPTTTEEYSTSPTPSSPLYVAIESDRALELEPKELTRISRGSSEYLTAKVPSSRESVASFDTCPTIPSESDYATADERSSYSSARGSSKAPSVALSAPAPGSEYITAPLIPSEESTPRLSSARLSDEELLPEPEVEGTPSRAPTIRSLASSVDGLSPQPQNIPLPPSTVLSERSLPPTPFLPPLLPTTTLRPAPVSVTDDSGSVVSSLSMRDLPPLPSSPATLASERDESLLRSISPMQSRASLTRSPFSVASSSEPREPSPPPMPFEPSRIASLTESSIIPVEDLPLTSSSPSTPLPPSPLWPSGDNETDRSYDSSQLQPSPSMMSIAFPEGPDRSFETSLLRPSGSVVSSINKLSTLPASPSGMTSRASLPRPDVGAPLPRPVVVAPPFRPTIPDVRAPLPQRTDPVLGPPVARVPESTSSTTPTTQMISSSSSSSFLSGLSSSTPSVLSPPSSHSLLDLRSLLEDDVEEESVAGRAPRTISTLLSTAHASAQAMSRSPTPVPIPPRTYTVTPEGSVVVSLSTPYGSGGTEQASLRTEESEEEESLPTPRDIARDIDRLAEDLRHYDDARGRENKEVADNVKALRDELQDLSHFLRQQSPPPPNVIRIIERQAPPPPSIIRPSRALESRSVGDSTEITSLHYLSIPESVGHALTRASSISSVGSFLSSHYSDDLSLYGYPSAASQMPPISDVESEYEDESSFASSSDVTLSEAVPRQRVQEPMTHLPVQQTAPTAPFPVQQPTAPLPVQPPTAPLPIQPSTGPLSEQPPISTAQQAIQTSRSPSSVSSTSTARSDIDLIAPLNAIREQLNSLANEQASALQKLDSLGGRQIPDVNAVQNKVNRIEDLLLDLIERFESRPEPRITTIPVHQPVTAAPQPLPQGQTADVQHPASDIERASLSDSDESSVFRRLESDLLAPRAQPAGPSFAEQLQAILSSAASIAQPVVQQPPALHRFRFEPIEGVARPRSASPASLESLAQRRMSIPTVADDLHEILRNLPRDQRDVQPRQDVAPSTEEQLEEQPQPSRPPDQTRRPEGDWVERAQQRQGTQTMPPPQPIFPPVRPPTAPSSLGGAEREQSSWYRQASPAGPTDPTTQQRPTEHQQAQGQPSHVPVPPGPTHVQLPPIFEQLMTYVRESHLAQTATYQQQQDLSRYMRELNEWLARDVNDRQDEFRGVTARLDQLANTLLALQSRRPDSTITESEVSLESRQHPPIFHQPVAPVTMPEPQHYQGGFIPPRPRTQQPAVHPAVHPPVVPPTPEPDDPVIPSPLQRPIQGGPVIPPALPPVMRHPQSGPVLTPVYPPVFPLPLQRSGDHSLPLDVIERSDSSVSSSVESSSPDSSRRTRRSERDRPSTSASDRRPRSATPRPHQQRQPTQLSYRSPSRSPSSSRGSSGGSIRHSSDESSSVGIHVVPPPGIIVPQEGLPIPIQGIPVQPSGPLQPSRVPSVHIITPSTQPLPGTPRHPEWQPIPQQQPPQPPTNIILQQPIPGPTQPIGPQGAIGIQLSPPSSPPGSSSFSTRRSSSHQGRSERRPSTQRSSSRSHAPSFSRAATPLQPLPVPPVTVYPLPPGQIAPAPGPQITIIRSSQSLTESPTRSDRTSRSRTSYRDSLSSPSHPDVIAVPGSTTIVQPQPPQTTIHMPTTQGPQIPRPASRPEVDVPGVGQRAVGEEPDRGRASRSGSGRRPHSPRHSRSPRRSRSPRHSGSPRHSRSLRHSRSPPITYPSDYSRRGYSPRRGRRHSRSYSYSPTRRSRRHHSYSRSTSPSYRHVTRYLPPISRSPTPRRSRYGSRYGSEPHRTGSPSMESLDREIRSPSVRSRPTTRRSPPSRHEFPSVERGSRSPLESPERHAPPSEQRSRRPSDARIPREASPSPLPRRVDPILHRPYGSRSPTPTRSPTPRYVRPPSERGRDETITVVVPRRDRSPTVVSLAPEELPRDTGDEPRGAISQRSPSGESFSARPSLYTPSRQPSTRQPSTRQPSTRQPSTRQPSVHRSPRDEPSVPPDLASRDDEESYRRAPTIQEPPRTGRTASGSTVSRRPTPLDLQREEEHERQLQGLDDVESRLHDVEASVREAEDQRELAFRENENDRHRLFLENQQRRDQEAGERAERILETINSRLASLAIPAPPPPAHEAVDAEEPEAVAGDAQSMIDSVRTASQEAALQYSRDIQDIIKAERDELTKEREAAAAERERLLADAEAERNRLAEGRDARIRDLEEQLASVKQELEVEKQRRITEEAEARERQRQELEERDDAVRNQLGDITNLIQDQRQVCEAKKDLMQAQWDEKQQRRLEKDAKMIELFDMVSKLHEDLDNDRVKAEECRREAEAKPGYDKIIEELARQNAEQRELLTQFSESWRADCIRHHEETINAVRQTAQEQVPFNVQGYLDEFSKALATEVRMLLGEVGKLREERRMLHYEIGFLLSAKSKYGPGGEFDPDWKPGPHGDSGSGGPPGPPGPPGDAPPREPQPPVPEPTQARPGWRQVPRRKKKKDTPAASAPPPAVDPRHQSWSTWQPDPQLAPTPPSVEPTLIIPTRSSPGLFGPRSQHSSVYNT
ncbi:hypothetical protein APHAL10511_007257 [Amanita phalloides]|nr:hypothetical protein APHAL10511_007257 [Amanita phalloides]